MTRPSADASHRARFHPVRRQRRCGHEVELVTYEAGSFKQEDGFFRVDVDAYGGSALGGSAPGGPAPGDRAEAIGIVDANKVLQRSTFQQYLRDGVRLRIIADYVRALRIRQRRTGGILADGDQLCLRPLPLTDMKAPRFGHWCATMPRPRCGYRCSAADAAKKQEMEFLACPQDWVYPATPANFAPNSPILETWICDMEAKMGTNPKKIGAKASDNMVLMAQAFTKWGCEHAFLEPVAFTPFEHHFGRDNGVIMKDQAKNFAKQVDAAIHQSYGCNAFWSSTAPKPGASDEPDPYELGALRRVEKGSAWDTIRQMLLKLK